MTVIDERTEDQQQQFPWMVVMTDAFLSDYAPGGRSFAAWACRYFDLDQVERWVSSRSDARRVRIVKDPYRPKGPGHLHIYVWEGKDRSND